MRISTKQNNFVSTDRIDDAFCAYILGDILSPDSCRFMMLGIPNTYPLLETVLVAGMASLITLSHVTLGLSAETVYPS